jgi:pimeloyl-ACP methyl ester carboxylesterase
VRGAKYWAHVLTEIKNRGTKDCCILVCDGLTGLPDAVASVWPQTIVQACVVHLLRNSFRDASRKDWPAIAKDLKPIYTAPTEAAALDRFAEFSERWEARYPAIVKLWENAWAEFVPLLAFANDIREVIYTTNAIESVNARIRKAVKARSHFPNEQAALKYVYLAVMSLDPTGKARQRWSNRWKPALNAFTVAFPGRITDAPSNAPIWPADIGRVPCRRAGRGEGIRGCRVVLSSQQGSTQCCPAAVTRSGFAPPAVLARPRRATVPDTAVVLANCGHAPPFEPPGETAALSG